MNSSVILLQSDQALTKSLVSSLSILFDDVFQMRSVSELRRHTALHCATAVIVDLEHISLSEVEHLCRDLPDVRIVCVHRLADEALWTAALNVGAADCCPVYDTRSILNAARGLPPIAHSVAA